MHINLESNENHSIEAYSDTQIQINSMIYKKSLLVSSQTIIDDIAVESIDDFNDDLMKRIMDLKPEIIIIGHKEMASLPMNILSDLSQQRIGVEVMSVGAACRTYNVLLSEARAVVAVFIF